MLKSKTDEVIQELAIQPDPPYGRIKVTVPKGEYWLRLEFGDTMPRTLGTVLSGLALLTAIGLFGWDAWRRRESKQRASD